MTASVITGRVGPDWIESGLQSGLQSKTRIGARIVIQFKIADWIADWSIRMLKFSIQSGLQSNFYFDEQFIFQRSSPPKNYILLLFYQVLNYF